MLLKKPGGEAHAVGTRAAVVDVLRRLPDGRMHIAVEGARAVPGARGARRPLVPRGHDRAGRRRGRSARGRTTSRRRSTSSRASSRPSASTLEPPLAGSPLLDFEIVSRVDFGNDEKQELIELTSPHRPLRAARRAARARARSAHARAGGDAVGLVEREGHAAQRRVAELGGSPAGRGQSCFAIRIASTKRAVRPAVVVARGSPRARSRRFS